MSLLNHMKKSNPKKFLVLVFLLAAYAQLFAQKKEYTNPVLAGFYPDPGICRVGDDYFLVNSTFAYFPGIPVFQSKDLVNWKLTGHVLSRNEQLNLSGMGVSRGIFAPAIRYHDGLFYVTCTLVDGKGNFVVTAKNPAGPWSDPVWLNEVNGIDPSLFFDDDGKAYIVYNSIPPDNKSLYNGHRTIRMNEFDYRNLKVKSDNKILVNGGVDITKKPAWIEGPHIYKKYGYYYLMAAEGGTGFEHSEVVFRSKSLQEPFVPYQNNPILTQRNADPNRKFPITSTGHADLVELPDGQWQAVFLGTRPYEGDYYNTGRETFLAPVEWKEQWPVINPNSIEVLYHYPLPLPEHNSNNTKYSGNFFYKDDFSNTRLSADWIFLRNPKESWYSLTGKKGFLSLRLRPETVGGRLNPSYAARRQQHINCEASAALLFHPTNENEKAGLLVFQNENHFYFLCQSVEENKPVVQLYQSSKEAADSNQMILLATKTLNSTSKNATGLKIVSSGGRYDFYYSNNNNNWQLLKDNVDGKFLSTKEAGGFVGCTIGLYATSLGTKSNAVASYDWFAYKGDDEVWLR
jgi:alpha-N-arabinofuranosidase